MKKMALLVLGLSWVSVSCIKEKAVHQLTKQEMQRRVDSIVTERKKELEEAGKVDLNLRYKIEVKVKADSIINARKNAPLKDTTLTKAKVPGLMERNLKIKTTADSSQHSF